jgi:hypothetical protein
MASNISYKIIANSNATKDETDAISHNAELVGLGSIPVEKTGGTTDLGAAGAPEVILVLQYVGGALTTGFFAAIGVDVWRKLKDFVVKTFKTYKEKLGPEEQRFYNAIIVIDFKENNKLKLQIQFPRESPEELEDSLVPLARVISKLQDDKLVILIYRDGNWAQSTEKFKSQEEMRDEIFRN